MNKIFKILILSLTINSINIFNSKPMLFSDVDKFIKQLTGRTCNYSRLFESLANLNIGQSLEGCIQLFQCELLNTRDYFDNIMFYGQCAAEALDKNIEPTICLLQRTSIETNIKTVLFWSVLIYLTNKLDHTRVSTILASVGLTASQIHLLLQIAAKIINKT